MTSKLIRLQPCIKSKLDVEISKNALNGISELLSEHDKIFLISFEIEKEDSEYYMVLRIRVDGKESILRRSYPYYIIEDFTEAKNRRRKTLSNKYVLILIEENSLEGEII